MVCKLGMNGLWNWETNDIENNAAAGKRKAGAPASNEKCSTKGSHFVGLKEEFAAWMANEAYRADYKELKESPWFLCT